MQGESIMKHTMIRIAAVACLAITAPSLVQSAAAQVSITTSNSVGPGGVHRMSRTVHRGGMTVTSTATRGRFGFHGCNTVTRTRRTGFGIVRSSTRRCH